MSQDLSLLLKIKGDSTDGVRAASDTRTAITALRNSASANFTVMQAATKAPLTGMQNLTNITQVLGASTSALQGPLGGVAGRLRSVGTLATEAGTGVGIAGAAVGALIVVSAAAVVGLFKLGQMLFDLSKSTADYAGKLFDLSKQTNFTVETLSALTLAANDSGGSIDTIAASLGIFQANMVKAAEGNKEAAKTFRDLKIDTADQEKALRQAMAALFAMGETEKQSAEAKKLFGRAGKEVLGVIKETNGNLDEATKQYAAMGRVITTEAAAAADEFEKNLNQLNDQLAGIGRTIGFTVIPVLSVFFRDMSEGLTGNRDEWDFWARSVQSLVAGVLGSLQALADLIRTPGAFSIAGIAGLPGSIIANQRSLLERAGEEQIGISVSAIAERAARRGQAGAGTSGGGGKAAKDTFLADAKREAALAEKEALLLLQESTDANKRELDDRLKDIKEFTSRAIELSDARHDAEIVRINAEQEALDRALSRKLIKQKEYNVQDRELAIQNETARQKHENEVFQLEQDRDRQIAAAEQSARERQLQIAEEADQRTVARIRARGERELVAESEIERDVAKIIDEGFARRRAALQEEEQSYQTTAERRAVITDELIRLDGERAGSAESAAERIVAAQTKEAKRAGGRTPNESPDSEPFMEQRGDAFSQFRRAIEDNLTGDTQTAALAGLEAMSIGFQQLGQAVGEAVHAFVLFGGAGIGVQKFAATMIAEIARMAAIQAIWELAQGFAMLAMNFFWPDPKLAASAAAHFHAAAIYGGMAVIAAGAGRAVAGNSFAQDSGSGGSSGGSRGGGSSSGSSSNKPIVQDFNRRNLNTPPVEVRVSFAPGIEDFLEAKILKNVRTPGKLRDAIGNN